MRLIHTLTRALQLVVAPAALALCAATASAQVSLQPAPKNPLDSWEDKGGQTIVMTSTRVSVSGTESAIITSFTVSAIGTVHDVLDISSLNLCLDVNHNGCWDQGIDIEIVKNKTFSADNGSYTFTFSRVIQAGNFEDWMVVIHLAGTASANEWVQFSVAGTACGATGATSGTALTITGVGTTGGKKTVCSGHGTLTVCDYVVCPPTGCCQGINHWPIAGVQLHASSGAHLDISALTWTASGTGNDVLDVTQLKLWEDVTGDGKVDAGDRRISGGTVQYNTDDGTAVFSGLTEQIAKSTCERWLLTYDFAASLVKNTTFTASIANTTDVTVATNPTGGLVQMHGIPTTHATLTVPCGTDPTGTPNPTGNPNPTTTPTTVTDPNPDNPHPMAPEYCCMVAPGLGGGGGAGGLGGALEALLFAWGPLLLLAGALWFFRRREDAAPAVRRLQ